jgi:hypothetical protein
MIAIGSTEICVQTGLGTIPQHPVLRFPTGCKVFGPDAATAIADPADAFDIHEPALHHRPASGPENGAHMAQFPDQNRDGHHPPRSGPESGAHVAQFPDQNQTSEETL